MAKFQILIWILCKSSITPTLRQNHFLFRNISIVGIPKSTVLVIIFRVFMWPLLLINSGPQSIIPLQCFEMLYPNRGYHMLQARWKMEFLRHPLILQWHPRKRRIAVPRLKSKWKNIVYLLKKSMMHCLILGQKYLPF